MNSILLVATTFRAMTSRFDGFGLPDCMRGSLPDRHLRRTYWHCEVCEPILLVKLVIRNEEQWCVPRSDDPCLPTLVLSLVLSHLSLESLTAVVAILVPKPRAHDSKARLPDQYVHKSCLYRWLPQV